MKLSLGPVLYYWPDDVLLEFYVQMAESPVDTIYLGETICSKRHALRTAEWIDLARHLAESGKQVILSTLTLIEAESELSTVARLCNNGELLVEANDMAAVQLLIEKQLPFVAGSSINLYNTDSLHYLQQRGMLRWVPPVELSGSMLAAIMHEAGERGFGDRFEVEIFSFGHLPLTYSARCFTARAHNLPKDKCEFACLKYPDGLPLHTQEAQQFLVLNGIQIQSGNALNLLPLYRELQSLGVDYLRLSPQSRHTREIVDTFYKVLQGDGNSVPDLAPLMDAPACDGYWYGEPGMALACPSAGSA